MDGDGWVWGREAGRLKSWAGAVKRRQGGGRTSWAGKYMRRGARD